MRIEVDYAAAMHINFIQNFWWKLALMSLELPAWQYFMCLCNGSGSWFALTQVNLLHVSSNTQIILTSSFNKEIMQVFFNKLTKFEGSGCTVWQDRYPIGVATDAKLILFKVYISLFKLLWQLIVVINMSENTTNSFYIIKLCNVLYIVALILLLCGPCLNHLFVSC